MSFGLADCYGFDFVQTSSSNGNVVFEFMFVAEDSSNLHDNSAYASEVVYGSNISQASWEFGEETNTALADDGRQTYMRSEMLAAFGTTLPASGSGSHFNYGVVANSGGATKTVTWTTARTIKAIIITGASSTPYWSNGYVQPYIGGNTASDLSSTQYTFLQGTSSSVVNNKYYDFSA